MHQRMLSSQICATFDLKSSVLKEENINHITPVLNDF